MSHHHRVSFRRHPASAGRDEEDAPAGPISFQHLNFSLLTRGSGRCGLGPPPPFLTPGAAHRLRALKASPLVPVRGSR